MQTLFFSKVKITSIYTETHTISLYILHYIYSSCIWLGIYKKKTCDRKTNFYKTKRKWMG